jgi:small basic protein (TIGR04137 family)
MSLDRSLKGANALVRHRNVLNRAERLEKLKDEEKWDENKSVFGLPKVEHRKAAVIGKVKEEATAETVEGAPAGATPAAGAPGAKGAGAPGAKGAGAPGAKGAAASGAKGAAAPAATTGKAAPAAKGKK